MDDDIAPLTFAEVKALAANGAPTHEYTFSVQVLHTVTVTAPTIRDGRLAATEALIESGTVECVDLELIDGEPF